MRIKEAQKRLDKLFQKYDDIELYMEIGKDKDCSNCGEPHYESVEGMCQSISEIKIDNATCAWLRAERD